MKSPNAFIVTPAKGRRYDNIRDIDGVGFITSTSQEDHKASNRFAEVVETPAHYSGAIKKGDTLLVHHNVFKYYYDMKGKQRSGKSWLKDNTFLIDPEQFFMYKNEDGWICHDVFCFIKPTGNQLEGTVKYANKDLIEKGLKVGDTVYFTPESEYEFEVDGEILYRIRSVNITLKWN